MTAPRADYNYIAAVRDNAIGEADRLEGEADDMENEAHQLRLRALTLRQAHAAVLRSGAQAPIQTMFAEEL